MVDLRLSERDVENIWGCLKREAGEIEDFVDDNPDVWNAASLKRRAPALREISRKILAQRRSPRLIAVEGKAEVAR